MAAEYLPQAWIRRSNEQGTLWVTTCFAVEGVVGAVAGFVAMMLFGNGIAMSFAGGILLGAGFSYWLHATGFGFYGRWTGVVAVGKLEGEEKAANILHELGHRVEHVVPGIVEYEKAFLGEKLGRIPGKWGPVAFIVRLWWTAVGVAVWIGTLGLVDLAKRWRSEKARGVFHEYVAHERPDGRSYEVLSMGLEGLHFGAKNPESGEFDPELRPYDDHRELIERMINELR